MGQGGEECTGGKGVFTWQAHGEFIVSELTINSPWACWVNTSLPPVMEGMGRERDKGDKLWVVCGWQGKSAIGEARSEV